MLDVKEVRNILAVLGFLIFSYQTFQAVTTFISSPTVVIKSETTWENIKKPRKQIFMLYFTVFSIKHINFKKYEYIKIDHTVYFFT